MYTRNVSGVFADIRCETLSHKPSELPTEHSVTQ